MAARSFSGSEGSSVEARGLAYVRLCTSREPLVLELETGETAERLCARAARLCGVGPVAIHLFRLCYDVSRVADGGRSRRQRRIFLAGCRPVDGAVQRYSLLIRHKIPDPARLLALDRTAFDYWFHQVREAFLQSALPGTTKREDALGLAVTDMFRFMLEMKMSRADVEKNYKMFVPRDLLKSHQFFLRSPMRRCLVQLEGKGIGDVNYIKLQYLLKVTEMYPSYGDEMFSARIDEEGSVKEVRLFVDPFHPTQPGIRRKLDADNYLHICSISDLCYISIRKDHKVELARRNGVPQYLGFTSQLELESFVSLLEGYYRLLEKWTFCLSKELQSPEQCRLRLMRCHGPVGEEFAHRKLLDKRDNQIGCYIIRQSNCTHAHYLVDVCETQGGKPTVMTFAETEAGKFFWQGEDDLHDSVCSLLSGLSSRRSVSFKECLPPSEQDETVLRLCRDPTREDQSAVRRTQRADVIDQPVCIPAAALRLDTGRNAETYGRYTVVQRARWISSPGNVHQVAVKRLKQHMSREYLQTFIDCVSGSVQWSSDALVRMRGVCLRQAVSLVMDWYPLGPLDVYLRNNQHAMQQVDLVEAGTYLAKALWYLDEQQLIHGNIRCRNVLVAAHTDAKFHVKLADPGLPLYSESQIHWIPVECYDQPDSACHSTAADVWAYGTTLWELFSLGAAPLEGEDVTLAKQLYIQGGRLPPPDQCHRDVYRLMRECWILEPHNRKTPQSIMRDINQILYDVFNARLVHTYATLSSQQQHIQPADHDSTGTCTTTVAAADGDTDDSPPLTAQCSVITLDSTLSGAMTDSSAKSGITVVDLMSQPLSVSAGSLPDALCPEPSSDLFKPAARERLVNIGMHKLLIPALLGAGGDDGSDSVTPISPLDICEVAGPSFPRILQLNQSQLQLGDTLGTGFYGEVYKGVLTHEDGSWETVAVKRLKRKAVTSAGHQDLQREIAILKELRHDNVVKLRGIVEEPELMLVIEYVPLGSLLSYLKMYSERVTSRQLLKFSLDVAQGMDYLGEMNVIHRDLAARNILVMSDTRVKISDFGLAQVASSSSYYYMKSSRELPFRWYAPESIRYGKFSTKSDVWSYGITLFEMFSGGEDPRIPNCDDQRLLETLDRGVRLCCPSRCPVGIFTALMWPCWNEEPDARPSFSDLIHSVNALMRQY